MKKTLYRAFFVEWFSCLFEVNMYSICVYFLFYIMLDQLLQEYGLSKTEAQSYLATLELGTAPVSSIARRSGENRVTVYSALKNLVKKWIALETPKKWSTYYSVISPENLITHVKNKYTALEAALPQFMAIANKFDNKPKVEFYEWLEGLKNIYDDHLTSKETLLSFLGVGEIEPKFKEYLYKVFLPKRVKAKIYAKVIVSGGKDSKIYANKDNKNLKETIMISDSLFKLDNEIVIYGTNKVSISMFSKNEMTGLIIKSKTLHDTLASLFDLTWKSHMYGKNK
jgi:HTH-type transcriptional regulator, sugar sensing transcriptional regulator